MRLPVRPSVVYPHIMSILVSAGHPGATATLWQRCDFDRIYVTALRFLGA
jgi:hypothetical protein